ISDAGVPMFQICWVGSKQPFPMMSPDGMLELAGSIVTCVSDFQADGTPQPHDTKKSELFNAGIEDFSAQLSDEQGIYAERMLRCSLKILNDEKHLQDRLNDNARNKETPLRKAMHARDIYLGLQSDVGVQSYESQTPLSVELSVAPELVSGFSDTEPLDRTPR